MADPANRQYLPELNVDVRPKYFARSAMLLTCFGSIMALPLGMFIFLRGMSESGNTILWASMGGGTVVAVAWGSWVLSRKLFDKKMEDVEDDPTKIPQID